MTDTSGADRLAELHDRAAASMADLRAKLKDVETELANPAPVVMNGSSILAQGADARMLLETMRDALRAGIDALEWESHRAFAPVAPKPPEPSTADRIADAIMRLAEEDRGLVRSKLVEAIDREVGSHPPAAEPPAAPASAECLPDLGEPERTGDPNEL